VRRTRRCAGVDSGQLRQDRGGVGEFIYISVRTIRMTSCFFFLQATAPVWDLRSPTGLPGEFPENGDSNGGSGATSPATNSAVSDESQPATSASPSLRRTSGKIGSGAGGNTEPPPATMTVVEFTRVWWDHNSGAHSRLSVWRPVCPAGFVSVGDVAVSELQPPASTTVVRMRRDGASRSMNSRSMDPVAFPVDWECVWRDSGWRAQVSLFLFPYGRCD
jgi:hypothetical protein